MPEQRAIIDLSGRQLFELLMSLLVDTGYGDEDGNLTPLGEEYLLTIQEEEAAKTFDVALTTTHNLSAPEPDKDFSFMEDWDDMPDLERYGVDAAALRRMEEDDDIS